MKLPNLFTFFAAKGAIYYYVTLAMVIFSRVTGAHQMRYYKRVIFNLHVRKIQWGAIHSAKFQPVRPRKVVHLKRWTRFFETLPVGPNRSIEFWTEMSGNFG